MAKPIPKRDPLHPQIVKYVTDRWPHVTKVTRVRRAASGNIRCDAFCRTKLLGSVSIGWSDDPYYPTSAAMLLAPGVSYPPCKEFPC
jgi:hypothetical protein